MYYYLHGVVAMHTRDSIVVECHGVGYDCLVCHPDDFPIGESMFVFVCYYSYETENFFVGFKTLEEKNLYTSLTSVKGIGPRTALAAMSCTSVENLKHAIDQSDSSFLCRIPGIGRKTAQQIILDLKGKIPESSFISEERDRNLSFAMDALRSMGFKETEVKKAVEGIEEHGLSAEEYTKRALQNLSK
jgi:Holliday junction DNA helicase RuvA